MYAGPVDTLYFVDISVLLPFRGGGAAKKAVELTINNCNSLDNNANNDSSRGSSAKREVDDEEEETDQFTIHIFSRGVQ